MGKTKAQIVTELDSEMKELGAKAQAMQKRLQKIQSTKMLLSDTDNEFNKTLLDQLEKEK